MASPTVTIVAIVSATSSRMKQPNSSSNIMVELNGIEAIGTQIVHKVGGISNLVRGDLKVLRDDRLDALANTLLIGS